MKNEHNNSIASNSNSNINNNTYSNNDHNHSRSSNNEGPSVRGKLPVPISFVGRELAPLVYPGQADSTSCNTSSSAFPF